MGASADKEEDVGILVRVADRDSAGDVCFDLSHDAGCLKHSKAGRSADDEVPCFIYELEIVYLWC